MIVAKKKARHPDKAIANHLRFQKPEGEGTVNYSIRLSESLHESLTLKAKENHCTIADVIRSRLEDTGNH